MRFCIVILLCLLFNIQSHAQHRDQEKSISNNYNDKFIKAINDKYADVDKKLLTKANKSLTRLQRLENKAYKKLFRKDSVLARRLQNESDLHYAGIRKRLNETGNAKEGRLQLKEYLPAYDSTVTTIAFLQNQTTGIKILDDAKSNVQQLGNRMQAANEIKRILKNRKEQLALQLKSFGLSRELKSINKEVYYYQQQLNEYKSLLKDQSKIEKRVMSILRESSLFKEFMKKNSLLAQLFKLPDNYGSPESLAGLQTTASVQAMLQQRMAGAGVNPQEYLAQQMNQAQATLNKFKSKLNAVKNGSSSDITADGFTPNTQKTKTFFNRLEYGTNFQTQRLNSYFPVTTDIAMSVGYKINDKSVIGIGASYKLGWGNGIQQIRLSSEGVGLRSYIDWKLKGSFWISGGYEQNYYQRFSDFRQIQDINLWRQSALLGLSKKISLSKKRSSKIQLLYDFFYQKNNIRTQPLVFRVGYGF